MPWWPFHRPRPKPPHKSRPFPTRDGVWVRSLGEQRVANFLSRRSVPYEYEPLVEGLRPDFLLPRHKVVVEYWGGAGFSRYAARMAEKTDLYEAAGYAVVHLVPLHLGEVERVLDAELRRIGVLGQPARDSSGVPPS